MLNGDAVTYCFSVTNTGDATCRRARSTTPIWVSTEADMTVLSGSLSSLAPGESVELFFETTIDGDLVNTATVTGDPAGGSGPDR